MFIVRDTLYVCFSSPGYGGMCLYISSIFKDLGDLVGESQRSGEEDGSGLQ